MKEMDRESITLNSKADCNIMGSVRGFQDRAFFNLSGAWLSAVGNNHKKLYRNEDLALVSVENKEYPASPPGMGNQINFRR